VTTTATPAGRSPAPPDEVRRTIAVTGTRATVAALTAVALVSRVAVVLATRPLALHDDSLEYDRIGRLLAHGHGFGESVLAAGGGPTAFRPPLYPLFLGAVYRITGGSVTAARLVEAVLGAIAVALVFLLVRRIASDRVAVVAVAIAAVYPPLLLTGTSVMSESIFLPLELGALLAAVEHRRAPRGALLPALAGVLCGLGVLARPQGVVLAVPILLLVSWRTGRDRRPLVAAAAVVAAVALTVTPSIVRNAVATGHFVPVSDLDGFNIAGTYNADAPATPWPYRYAFRPPNTVEALDPLFSDRSLDEVELSARLRRAGTDYLVDHPGQLAPTLAWNTARLFDLTGRTAARAAAAHLGYGPMAADIAFASYAVMALLALAGAATRVARRIPVALWTAPVLLWLVTIPVLGTTRLRAPIEPFIVLLAACAVVAVADMRRT
jgi:hypothetical protein